MKKRLKTKWYGIVKPLKRKLLAWRLSRRVENHVCAYCDCWFTPTGKRQRTFDHIHPRSRGGTWSVRNMAFACLACNLRKGDADLDVFLNSEWLMRRRYMVIEERARQIVQADVSR